MTKGQEEYIRRKDYFRDYGREWIKKRRRQWILSHGPCQRCGSSKDLEVDHVDPASKMIEPAGVWSLRQDRREAELAKCQVLCRDCHKKKSSAERKAKIKPLVHGRSVSYKAKGCRCDLCREAAMGQKRQWRLKTGSKN